MIYDRTFCGKLLKTNGSLYFNFLGGFEVPEQMVLLMKNRLFGGGPTVKF